MTLTDTLEWKARPGVLGAGFLAQSQSSAPFYSYLGTLCLSFRFTLQLDVPYTNRCSILYLGTPVAQGLTSIPHNATLRKTRCGGIRRLG